MVREGVLRENQALQRCVRILAGGTAMAAAVLVYLNALNNPFIYDDFGTVLQNPSLVDPSNLLFVLVHSPFRPVVNISYAIDHVVWGPQPFGFHLTSILLHAASVGLLFAFILRVFEDARLRGERVEPGRYDVLSAFTGSLLFAVHPLMTEAVAYVSGRSELLCGLFFLAALLCGRAAMLPTAAASTVAARRSASGGTRRAFLALAALLFGVLAFLSKEVAIALPVVMVAYDWLLLPGTLEQRRRRFWLLWFPVFALATIAAAYRWTSLMALEAVPVESPVLTLMTQAIVVWRYVHLLVAPLGQSIMHGVHRVTSVGDPAAWAAIGAHLSLLVLTFRMRRTEPMVTFGVIWFFATLAPSSSVVALREGMAEHRVYFASAGLFVALSATVARSLAWLTHGRGVSAVHVGVVFGLAALLSLLTLTRNYVWASPIRVWSEAVRRAPGMWEPHYALGDVLRQAGDCERAIGEYEKAVAIHPRHRDSYTNLGICLGQVGRLAEAEAALRRALDIDPASSRGYTNLAAVALLEGKPDMARDLYLKAIAINPQSVLARMQLARLYEGTYDDYGAAARLCGEVRAIDPRVPGVVECVERNQRRGEVDGGSR